MNHDRREIETIKAEMVRLRSRLPKRGDAARAQARRWVDWKYHVRRYPLVSAAAIASVAYLLVPEKPKDHRRVQDQSKLKRGGLRDMIQGRREPEFDEDDAAKASVIGGLTSFATTMAIKAATRYASGYLDRVFDDLLTPQQRGRETLKESPNGEVRVEERIG